MLLTAALPERPVPLAKLAGRLGVHVSTVHRWRSPGVRGVRLDCLRIGGRWFTTEADTAAFLASLNDGKSPAAIRRSEENRQNRQAIEAERLLTARGV